MPFEADVGAGRGPLRYLWVTRVDPAPENNGERLYSGRLIDAVAAAGGEVDVLCFESDSSPWRPMGRNAGIAFWTVEPTQKPGWGSLLSRLPNFTYQNSSPEISARLRALLSQHQWDVVVLDGIAAGWALSVLESFGLVGSNGTRVVYVSHNHETSTRARVAQHYTSNPLMQGVLRYDSYKVAWLEGRMVQAAHVVTAITDEDAQAFRHAAPGKRVVTLSPGYSGRRRETRHIGADTPRQAVIVGSFEWIAKKMNLEAFLDAADPLFAEAGIQLRVIGKGSPGFLEDLSRRMRATEFTGPVKEIGPYMADARLAIVPELTGGGFKLKLLDYVFHRLPIVAIDGSLSGVPLRHGDSVLTYRTFDDLARGVVDSIDNVDLLNRLQDTAFERCDGRFDWRRRGELFIDHTAYA
ncbi:MAG: glycosyltransferase family 4 protein [Acetobacterales bacterium]